MTVLPVSERLEQLRRAHPMFRVALPIACGAYLLLVATVSRIGPEHLLLVALVLGFSLWSDQSRRLARIALPFLLWAAVYDSMRWYEDYIRSPIIHTHEPYAFDLRFFGIREDGNVLTPNEWLQRHTHPVLDLFCGLAYTPFLFIGESIVLALYLHAKGHSRLAERFTWVFVWTNFVGFSVYYLYPAAPPWYAAAHGFVADLTVRASPGGAIRFDQLVGLPIFQSFYGKSADVFGAIPSLHVAYPLLAMIYGFRLPRFRVFAVAYLALICFSAVYLDHHYILDILLGFVDALLVMAVFRALFGPALAADEPEAHGAQVPA